MCQAERPFVASEAVLADPGLAVSPCTDPPTSDTVAPADPSPPECVLERQGSSSSGSSVDSGRSSTSTHHSASPAVSLSKRRSMLSSLRRSFRRSKEPCTVSDSNLAGGRKKRRGFLRSDSAPASDSPLASSTDDAQWTAPPLPKPKSKPWTQRSSSVPALSSMDTNLLTTDLYFRVPVLRQLPDCRYVRRGDTYLHVQGQLTVRQINTREGQPPRCFLWWRPGDAEHMAQLDGVQLAHYRGLVISASEFDAGWLQHNADIEYLPSRVFVGVAPPPLSDLLDLDDCDDQRRASMRRKRAHLRLARRLCGLDPTLESCGLHDSCEGGDCAASSPAADITASSSDDDISALRASLKRTPRHAPVSPAPTPTPPSEQQAVAAPAITAKQADTMQVCSEQPRDPDPIKPDDVSTKPKPLQPVVPAATPPDTPSGPVPPATDTQPQPPSSTQPPSEAKGPAPSLETASGGSRQGPVAGEEKPAGNRQGGNKCPACTCSQRKVATIVRRATMRSTVAPAGLELTAAVSKLHQQTHARPADVSPKPQRASSAGGHWASSAGGHCILAGSDDTPMKAWKRREKELQEMRARDAALQRRRMPTHTDPCPHCTCPGSASGADTSQDVVAPGSRPIRTSSLRRSPDLGPVHPGRVTTPTNSTAHPVLLIPTSPTAGRTWGRRRGVKVMAALSHELRAEACQATCPDMVDARA